MAMTCLFTLVACGGGGGGGSSRTPPPPAPEPSGLDSNAIKGPLENTEITLTDANDSVIDAFTANGAGFTVDLPDATAFPVIVTSSGGVDSILGHDVSEDNLVLKGVVLSADQTIVNLNPFSTLLVDTALARGGLTQENLDASDEALDLHSFGLPAGFDPLTSEMTDENTPELLIAFETVFEAFRRVSRQQGIEPNEVISNIAADLSDDVLDGQGTDGTDSVSTALFNTNSADVLIESLAGELQLDAGGDNEQALAPDDINAATGLVTGNAGTETEAALEVTEETIDQTVNVLNVALRSADEGDQDALGTAVNFLESIDPANPPPQEETVAVVELTKASLSNVAEKNQDPDNAAAANAGAAEVFSNPDNQLPFAVNDHIEVPAGSGTAIVNVMANDTGLGDTPISFTLDSVGSGGDVSVNEDNTLSFTPDAGFFGGVEISYEVEDADGETSSATAVLYVDDLPVSRDFREEIAIGQSLSVDIEGSSTGLGNTPVNFTVTSPPSHGSVVASGGVFQYTPDAGYAGDDGFTVTLEDADGDMALSDVVVYVDDLPVAIDDSGMTPLGVPITLDPLANDTGLGNAPVMVALSGSVTGGTAVITGTSIEFTPAAGFGGTAVVPYSVTDADGDTDTGVVNILVNDIPVAEDDSTETTVGNATTVFVLDNDTGLGNTPLTISASTPANGSATVSGDNISYTPDSGFAGNDSFTYTITDSNGDQATATVSVFVDALAVASGDAVDTRRDTAVTVDVLANDNLGNGPTSVTLVADPANGTAAVSGSDIVYTPDSGFAGLDTFEYTITDSDGDQSTATVSVNVDDFPVLADQDLETPLATLITIDLLSGAVGLADTPLTIVITTPPANGTLVENGTTVDYTPDAGFHATDTFQYTVTDNNGDSDTATVNVFANDTPVAVADLGLETPVGTALNNIDVLGNDIRLGNIPLTVTINTGSEAGGTASVNPDNTVNFTPSAGYGGQGQFQYTVEDNDGETASAVVQVYVEDIPVAMTDSVDTPVDTAINIDVLSNDTGKLNTPLMVAVTSGPASGTAVVESDNTITYTPNPGTVNTDNFNYTLTDGDADASIATVAVYMDDTPTAVDDTSLGLTTQVATVLNIDVAANDIGAGNIPLIFAPDASGNATVVDKGDNTIDYTPNVGFAGNDSFTYSFTDGDGDNSGSATVDVFVNDTPVAVDDSAGTPVDTPVVIDVLANDTGKLNVITDITVTVNPTGGTIGTINVGAGTIEYIPNVTGLANNDAFSYRIEDTDGETAVAVVNVGVGFRAFSDTLDVVENTPDGLEILGTDTRTLNVLANDTLGPSPDATITAVDTTGTTGNVAFTGTEISYTPAPGSAPGSDTFSYTITNSTLAQDATATVTVNIVSICTETKVRCVGPGEEYDTAAAVPDVETAFQAAIDAAVAGDSILIREGTYEHDETSAGAGHDTIFMYVTESTKGTAGNPITIRAFTGDQVTISGYGFPDCEAPNVIYMERDTVDYDGDGDTTEPNFDVNDERGNADYESADGSTALVPLDVIKVSPGHTAGGDAGRLYRYRGSAATINLSVEDFTKFITNSPPDDGPWEIVNYTHPHWGNCYVSLIDDGSGVLRGVDLVGMEPDTADEILINLEGDYIHVRDLELEWSTRNAVRITGSHNTVENVVARHSFKSNFTVNSLNTDVVAPFGNIIGNTLKNVESAYARHEVGINITPSSDNPRLIENTTIIDSYSHHSGYQPDGRQVPGVSGDNATPGIGGGNADGIGASKVCHDFPFRYAAQTGEPEPPNLCPGTVIQGNVSFHNADDGIDNSTGGVSSTGVITALVDNISFNAGPEGNKAFKFFSALRGGAEFRGNIGLGVSSFCFELQWEGDPGYVVHNGTFYCLANGYDLRVREMANDNGLKFHNNNAWNNSGGTDGRLFSLNSFAVGGLNPDKDILASNNFSEDDFSISGGATTYPAGDKNQGVTYVTSDVFTGELTNTTMLGRNLDSTYTTVDSITPPPGSSIIDKVNHFRQQFFDEFSPKDAASPLVNAGLFIPGIHCPLADDNGQDPNDTTCRHWMGAAPDIGPYEFGLPVRLAAP